MDVLILVLRLVLAVVFAFAAVAKLVSGADFRRAVGEFGVPAQLAPPVAVAVPVAELAVAVALPLPGVAWWGAIAGVALLLAFSAVVAVNLARGRAPECNCFGRLSSGPVGRGTLVRNGILAAAGTVVVAGGTARARSGAFGWLAGLTVAQRVEVAGAVVVLFVLAFQGWMIVHLVGQSGRLLDRIAILEHATNVYGAHRTHLPLAGDNGHHHTPPAPAVGEPAPDVALADLDGNPVRLAERLAGGDGPTVLLFWSPTCGFCQQIGPELRAWEAERPADEPRLLVVTSGSAEQNRAMGLTSPTLLDSGFTAGRAFGATGTPQAVLVDGDGTIASPLAAGGEALLNLVKTQVARA